MSNGKRTWRRVAYTLGSLNLLFSAFGIYLACQSLMSTRFLANTAEEPFVVQAFYVMTVANLVLLVMLAWAGYLLLTDRSSAAKFCNFVFVAESLYIIVWLFLPFKGSLSLSVAAASGIGNVGTTPQLLVLYPLVGLLALKIGRRSVQRQDPTDANARQQSVRIR